MTWFLCSNLLAQQAVIGQVHYPVRRRKFYVVKNCSNYIKSFLHFFYVRCAIKPNSHSRSEFLCAKPELWGSQKRDASLYGAEAAPHFHC